VRVLALVEEALLVVVAGVVRVVCPLPITLRDLVFRVLNSGFKGWDPSADTPRQTV